MPDSSERLAVLEANYHNHAQSDSENFERIFDLMQDMKTEILDKLAPIDIKVSSLWDEKNKREGAFGLSKIIVGTLGGTVGAAVMAAVEWYKK